MTEINPIENAPVASKPRKKGSVGLLMAAVSILAILVLALSEIVTVRNELAYPVGAVLLFFIYMTAKWMKEEASPIMNRFSLSPIQRFCATLATSRIPALGLALSAAAAKALQHLFNDLGSKVQRPELGKKATANGKSGQVDHEFVHENKNPPEGHSGAHDVRRHEIAPLNAWPARPTTST